MPKPTQPNQSTETKIVDSNVVSLKSLGQDAEIALAKPASSDQVGKRGAAEIRQSMPAAQSGATPPASPLPYETSERWASAILSLMHVERSRFQDSPVNIPRVHIASLEAIGCSKSAPSGSAHSSITLRKPRTAQEDTSQEASKIHAFQSLSKPKP